MITLNDVISDEKCYILRAVKKFYLAYAIIFGIMGWIMCIILYAKYEWQAIHPWAAGIIGIGGGCLAAFFVTGWQGKKDYLYFRGLGDIWHMTFTLRQYEEDVDGYKEEIEWYKGVTPSHEGTSYILTKLNQPALLIDSQRLPDEARHVLEEVLGEK